MDDELDEGDKIKLKKAVGEDEPKKKKKGLKIPKLKRPKCLLS
jgi:hypothetical protein